MTSNTSTKGSMLLYALALVAVASMIAYSFAVSGQAHATSNRALVITALAQSAARMGARHAFETVARDYIAKPEGVTSPVGPHFTHFMNHNHPDASAWIANPLPIDPMTRMARLDPKDNNKDNVPYEARLNLIKSRFVANWISENSEGYKGMGENSFLETATHILGSARYIEPGNYNRDGLLKPVRFSTVPGSTPDHNSPIYFDASWKPTSTRSQARYRLRYAVNAVDLGGHLVWGRQAPYGPTITPTINPQEWDKEVGKTYAMPFFNMLASDNLWDDDPWGTNRFGRPMPISLFMGYGCAAASGAVTPGNLLSGFKSGGGIREWKDDAADGIDGLVSIWWPPSAPPTCQYGGYGGSFQGGPPSWDIAKNILKNDRNSGSYIMTPFGRATSYSATPTKYYEAKVTNPWRVNLLTAPAGVIKRMIGGYLPPQIIRPMNRLDATKPGPITGSGIQVQNDAFRPAPGIIPFAGHYSPDYNPAHSSAPVAVDYVPAGASPPSAYPDYAEFWEDYTNFENSSLSISDPLAIKAAMLGGEIDVFDSGATPGIWFYRTFPNNSFGCAREPLHGMFGIMIPMRKVMSENGSHDITPFARPYWGFWSPVGFKELQPPTRPYFHKDSYWLDLAHALAGAITIAKATHLDTESCGVTETKDISNIDPFLDDPVAEKSRITTVREVDRLFLALLGEYFQGDLAAGPGGSDVSKPGLVLARGTKWPVTGGFDMADFNIHNASSHGTEYLQGPKWLIPATASANILKVKSNLAGTTNINRKVANMERVLNDMRLSFFGANPWYNGRKPGSDETSVANRATEFRAFDFDADGWASCSGYSGLRSIDGKDFPGTTASSGVADSAPDKPFSVTGYFVMEKGRYWRILTRGEVWDELLQQTISESNLETVIAIDPDGTSAEIGATPSLSNSCTLYSHWTNNAYSGLMPKSR